MAAAATKRHKRASGRLRPPAPAFVVPKEPQQRRVGLLGALELGHVAAVELDALG
jgi:hypothetical protein